MCFQRIKQTYDGSSTRKSLVDDVSTYFMPIDGQGSCFTAGTDWSLTVNSTSSDPSSKTNPNAIVVEYHCRFLIEDRSRGTGADVSV